MSTQEMSRSPFADHVAGLDARRLAPIAAQVLDVDAATVTSWQTQSISRGGTSAGMYRISGQAQVKGKARPWSTVVKLLRREASDYDGYFAPTDDPAGVTYWRREYELYRSGLLDDLPVPLVSVRCYQTDARDGILWCWLEDLGDIEAERWTDEQFALAGRHLGMFNGLWLNERSVPTVPWLAQGLVRWRYEKLVQTEGEFRTNAVKMREAIGLEADWTDEAIDGSCRLLADCPEFLESLEELPKTFMHQDAGRKSLMQRMGASGQPETIAFDWAFSGIGEVGGEIATLVSSSSRWFGLEPERLPQVEKLVIEQYLEGLRAMGWHGDAEEVRLAYLLTSAIMFRPGITHTMWQNIERFKQSTETMFGRRLELVYQRWGQVNHFVLQKAEEAREILGMGRSLEVGHA